MVLDTNNDFLQTTDLIVLGAPNALDGSLFPVSRSDSVSSIDDSADFYKVRLDANSNLNVTLSGVSTSTTVELIRNSNNSRFGDPGEIIQTGVASNGSISMSIEGLGRGDYGVRVATTTGSTNYSLGLAATVGAGREQTNASAAQPQFLNALNSNRLIKGTVDTRTDLQDFYRFRVDVPTKLSASLFSSNTFFTLTNPDGSVDMSSRIGDTTNHRLDDDYLAPGNYIIAPQSSFGSSDYTLNLAGTPITQAQVHVNVKDIVGEDLFYDDFGLFSSDAFLPDFYTKVTINGKTQTSRTVDNTKRPSLNFTATQTVDPSVRTIPIKIEVFDSDIGPDQKIDIHPRQGVKDLNLTLDVATGVVSGEGLVNQPEGLVELNILGRDIPEDSDLAERAGLRFKVSYDSFGFGQTSFSNSTPTMIGSNSSDITSGRNLGGIVNGRGGNDEVYAKGGDDVAMGGVSNDYVDGGTGDDVVFGGLGKDTCVGGKGRDTIVLAPGTGVDVIEGFRNNTDKLGLANAVVFEMLEINQQGRNTVIRLGGERLASLKDVRANQIGAEDFVAIDFTSFKGMEVPTIVV